jgi:hypothetical protein
MIDRILRSKDLFVLRSPGGINYAEEFQIRVSGILNILLGIRCNIDYLIGMNLGGFFVNVHDAFSLKDVINLGGFQLVRQGTATGLHYRMSYAVMDPKIVPVRMQKFAEDGLITCYYLVTRV